MTVHLHGELSLFLYPSYQTIRIDRTEETGHILDTYRIGSHIPHLSGDIDEQFVRVHRRYGIGNTHLEVGTLPLDLVGRNLKVSKIVQGIEHPHYIDSVTYRPLDEFSYDIVSIMSVSDQILSTKEHLKLSVLDMLSEDSKAFPRVLVEESHAGVEGGPSPHLQGVISNLVHLLQDRQHILDPESSRHEGLVSIPQSGLGYPYFPERVFRLTHSLTSISSNCGHYITWDYRMHHPAERPS